MEEEEESTKLRSKRSVKEKERDINDCFDDCTAPTLVIM